ncbi:reverse transcriptase domain-containing protein [Tanacetum coccineum]
MPFGLKNAGATYQRLVDKAFQKQISRNLEVYVDDLVIKICTEHEIIIDMEETFKTLREINIKLNPNKCTFKIEEGAFLGYRVNTEGIMVCPNKVKAVLNLPSLKCLKDVQKLNGKLASLSRFLSKSAKKSLPDEKIDRKAPNINCTNGNRRIDCVPCGCMRSRSRNKLHVNGKIGTSFSACKQTAKKILSGSHNYCHHGPANQADTVKTKARRKAAEWSIELGEYDMQYIPRTSVKGQILADFIVERPEDDSLNKPIEIEEELPDPWTLFTEGSSCVDGSGGGLILTNPKGAEFTYALRFRFDTTNNEAEYEALITGLRIAKQMGVKNLQANVDSRLVANQVLVEELKEKSIKEAEVLVVVEN